MKYKIFTLLLVAIAVTACNDTWEEHYNSNAGIKSNLSLFNYIKSQPDLSIFAKMLQIAKYDSVLSRPQTYTVWAPVNSALEGIDLSDTVSVKDIVKNHISRFSYPTSDITIKTILMVNSKFVIFENVNGNYSFGGKTLSQTNISTSNGILHKVDGFIQYSKNIWEYIGQAPDLDSLRAYLYSQNLLKFDKDASVEIGTNAQNLTIYDSVIIFSNPILDEIGHLNVEDSTFAAILPTNKAWIQTYNLIKSKFKTLAKDGGTAQQRLNTQFAIVQNTVFRFKNKTAEPTLFDSLTSTVGNVFSPSSYLFDHATKHTLSNGWAFVTDSLRFKAADSWQKPIKVEAENSNYGRSFAYAALSVRSSLGSIYAASETKYLVSDPTSVSKTTPNSVTFPIPNTLSGKYRVYCVFLPSDIVAEADNRKYKVRFSLSYLNSLGTQVNDAVITATNTINTTTGAIGGTFQTNELAVTKMFVTQIDFPFCNLLNSKSALSDITVRLKVENAAQITETTKYDRAFRIDYIILEPVQ